MPGSLSRFPGCSARPPTTLYHYPEETRWQVLVRGIASLRLYDDGPATPRRPLWPLKERLLSGLCYRSIQAPRFPRIPGTARCCRSGRYFTERAITFWR
jgi:hypothetical protein